MADFIEREAVLEKAWDADTRVGYVQVVDIGDILEAPAADVVAVVRCKDCERCKKYTNMFRENGLKCELLCVDVQPNDFCSYGERRGNSGRS